LNTQACVQRIEWFVKQDCTGPGCERAGKCDTLLLASGKLVRVAVTEFGKADDCEQAGDA